MSEDASTWAHQRLLGDQLLAHQRLLDGQWAHVPAACATHEFGLEGVCVRCREVERVIVPVGSISQLKDGIAALQAEIAALKAGAATPPPPPDPKALPANALKWSK